MGQIQQTENNNREIDEKENGIISERGVLFLKFNRMIKKIFLSDIDYFKAESNSTICFMKGEEFVLLRIQLNNIEKMLPRKEFVRVHKSYIISIRKIDKIINQVIYINEVSIPVGPCYRKTFYSMLHSYF